MAKRKRPIEDSTNEDAAGSFAEALRGLDDVAPIDRTNISKQPPPARQRPGEVVPAAVSRPPIPPEVDEGSASLVRASRSEMRQLRAGKIRPQETVDLHGFTREPAHRRLCNAVARAQSAGLRCLLVIHGRGRNSEHGRSILRDALDAWLTTPPLSNQVTGACRAQPRDGGTGASYLLLRTARPVE